MDFGRALEAMKEGKKITRKGLYGVWIALEDYPGWRDKALVLMREDGTKKINYEAYSTDLLADDWKIIDELPKAKIQVRYYAICPLCEKEYRISSRQEDVVCGKCGEILKVDIPDSLKQNK